MLDPRTGRGNRIGLAIVGAILLIGGAVSVAQTQSFIFSRSSTTPLITATETRFLHSHNWLWDVLAAIGFVIALVCLRWLAVQFRRQQVRSFRLEPDRTLGGTRIGAELLTNAVEDDIRAYPEVHRVRAHLTGVARRPELRLNIDLGTKADLARVRSRIENHALPRFRRALELDELPVQLTLRFNRAHEHNLVH